MALVLAIVHIMVFLFLLLCLFISVFRFLFCNTGRMGKCRGRLGCGPCVMSFLVSSGHPLTWLCPIEFSSATRNSTRQSYVVWHAHTGMAAIVCSTAGLAVRRGCWIISWRSVQCWYARVLLDSEAQDAWCVDASAAVLAFGLHGSPLSLPLFPQPCSSDICADS